jgi:hypothetical protein
MGSNAEVLMYRKFVELAKLLNVYLNHFPKHEKFALCNRIRNTAYEVYELIMEGQKRYHKKTTLTNSTQTCQPSFHAVTGGPNAHGPLSPRSRYIRTGTFRG